MDSSGMFAYIFYKKTVETDDCNIPCVEFFLQLPTFRIPFAGTVVNKIFVCCRPAFCYMFKNTLTEM
jgi:hypothetical protein